MAHSPDPDDAFMWWPITGKVAPDGRPLAGAAGRPVLDTGGLRFRAIPLDIERLNRRAIAPQQGQERYDITAVSFRAYADARAHYRLTSCGSSFGLGFGPKLVARAGACPSGADAIAWLADPGRRIAIPGMKTTAFMVLGLLVGLGRGGAGETEGAAGVGAVDLSRERFLELAFDEVIPAVARGRVDAGLVIHEGQITFADAGLVELADLGRWWTGRMGLPLPLGGNAIRRDLDERCGAGTLARVSALLRASIAHALEHREESIDYTMPFALANDRVLPRGGDGGGNVGGENREAGLRARVDRYIDMYVNRLTVDIGAEGLAALRVLFESGARAGLCPDVGEIDLA